MITETLSPVAIRFARAAESYEHEAVVQKQMARRLANAALPHLPQGGQWFEFGCGTGVLTREIIGLQHPHTFIGNDLVDENEVKIRRIAQSANCRFTFLGGDVEQLQFPQGNHMVWSGATLQWMTDLPMMFQKVAASLNHEGVFAFSTFGVHNFHQIKTITGNGLNYHSLAKLNNLLSVCFTALELTEWIETLTFSDPIEVLRHIKATGVGGVAKVTWCKKQLTRFCDDYERFYIPGIGYPLTYHPIVGIAKRVK